MKVSTHRGLGGLAMRLLAIGGWPTDGLPAQSGPKANRKRSSVRGNYLYMPKPRTTAARHWHDATDPTQAARIEAAAAKRARKADKLTHDATLSVVNNMAHGFTGQRHNSFYVAK